MSINYIKGDLLKLLKSPIQKYILHSCNCLGSWGGGFAYQLSNRYPQARQAYERYCSDNTNTLGTAILIPSDDHKYQIICLFTSMGGGGLQDSPNEILKNTEKALNHLKTKIDEDSEIHMPMINSGIFRTPWEDTTNILQKFNYKYNVYVL
ncbi:hypothetical protein WICMUC_005155 [Wickerhamomyces mucosus]|uniref:ADP-ribose 1''-phosphate phosphatase n=1 Tax=Wickerhamomyces mucosus TaxID=1378264 RepID=A0A9P8P9H6_9ASCO|nr:hypothetical protein WICMUC_005155 [Wickerhamomyces mucosus]